MKSSYHALRADGAKICAANTIKEAASALKFSTPKLYEEINSGRIESYRVGRRRYISERALSKYIEDREREQGPSTLPMNQPNSNRDRAAKTLVTVR